MLSKFSILGWLIILAVAAVGLFATSFAQQHYRGVEYKEWLAQANQESEQFVTHSAKAFASQLETLKFFSALAISQQDLTPEEFEAAIDATLLSSMEGNELSLALYAKDGSRFGKKWTYGSFSAIEDNNTDRALLNRLLVKAGDKLGEIQFIAPDNITKNIDKYVLASLAFVKGDDICILISRIDIGLIATDLDYFYQPAALHYRFELLNHFDQVMLSFDVGEFYQFGQHQIQLSRSQSPFEWKIQVAAEEQFNGGPDHSFSTQLFAGGVASTILLAVLTAILAMQSGLANRSARKTNEKLATTEGQLSQTKERLKRSSQIASLGKLVPVIANEVNAPLTKTISAVSSLEERAVNFKTKVEEGKISKTQVVTFLDSTINLSRAAATSALKAGEMVFNLRQMAQDQTTNKQRQFNLQMHVDELLATLQPTLNRTDHKFIATIPPQIDLNTRPGALTQALYQIIENAIRHGLKDKQAGVIMIEGFEGPEKGWISLRVEDNGSGIDQETLEAIKMGDNKITGIGVSLINELVETALQGRLKLESEAGKFTRLVIEIPKELK